MNLRSPFTRDIVVNFAGRIWGALMALAFVPLYIKAIGIEAYGLVGIFATLQTIFAFLDAGLSTTLNRELARMSTEEDAAVRTRDLVRTLELIYGAIAVAIACIVALFAVPIANGWVQSKALSTTDVAIAVGMIGITIALQFPFALYQGGLLGLQRQLLYNGLTVFIATLRGLGSLLILWYVSPTIFAFFGWQMVVSAIQSLISAASLWHVLPSCPSPPRFRWQQVREVWRFAAGVGSTGVLTLLLMQLDKLVLSRLLTLEKFGYYALASVVASGLSVLVNPIFTATFPRLSELVSTDDDAAIAHLFHDSSQLMAVLVVPAAAFVAVFSPELLGLWTGGDKQIVANTALLASLLTAGWALNGLATIPYALQLAYGWTSLGFYQNALAVVLLVPTMIVSTLYFGAVGAAATWVALNAGYVLISMQIMFRRLLPGEKRRWYAQDVALPCGVAVAVVCGGRLLMPPGMPLLVLIGWLLMIACAALAATAWATPATGKRLRDLLRRSHMLGTSA